ncbi:hypothetical protein V5799_014478 [Amblyomma americanum]|uniref:Tick transposon n=1 Tax=Amblyomma americanum TaxID=6943 RepID=A0AAQ4E2W6_AMBAM
MVNSLPQQHADESSLQHYVMVIFTEKPSENIILAKLAIGYERQQGIKVDLLLEELPRNICPEHHKERREKRAEALEKRFQNSQDVVYVDSADYGDSRGMVVAVVNSDKELIASGSVTTDRAETDEESVIVGTIAKTIVRDSQVSGKELHKRKDLT